MGYYKCQNSICRDIIFPRGRKSWRGLTSWSRRTWSKPRDEQRFKDSPYRQLDEQRFKGGPCLQPRDSNISYLWRRLYTNRYHNKQQSSLWCSPLVRCICTCLYYTWVRAPVSKLVRKYSWHISTFLCRPDSRIVANFSIFLSSSGQGYPL